MTNITCQTIALSLFLHTYFIWSNDGLLFLCKKRSDIKLFLSHQTQKWKKWLKRHPVTYLQCYPMISVRLTMNGAVRQITGSRHNINFDKKYFIQQSAHTLLSRVENKVCLDTVYFWVECLVLDFVGNYRNLCWPF